MPSEIKITVDELPSSIQEDAVYIINQPNPNSYTHNYFKYPCKFIPEIPRWAIRSYLDVNVINPRILDPFAGSGTSLLEAALMGIDSIGTEIDEVAKLLIKVKTTQLSVEEMNEARRFSNSILAELENGQYNKELVILPSINNLEHWFQSQNLEELGYIYYRICNIENIRVKEFLLICMAGIIKKVSNCDDISPKPYVSNKVKKEPPCVAPSFFDAVEKNLEGMNNMLSQRLARVSVSGDAMNIDADDNSIDLAVTSPPYINAFDYVRTMRLENLWLEMATEDELRERKKLYFGTESIKTKEEKCNLSILDESELLRSYYDKVCLVDEKRALILKKFFEDMKSNLEEVYRVLKLGAKYVIVIGNSSIRKVDVESWKVIKAIAINMGYNYITHIGYEIQNPYIRIPRGNKGGKIAIDHVLVLEK